MRNVKTKVTGNTLTVTVDLTKDFGKSKSTGKTVLVATGREEVADNRYLSLNVYKYPV